ncbi:MAG: hypothetical protein ACRD04_13655 [Terriglobales bacterium]
MRKRLLLICLAVALPLVGQQVPSVTALFQQAETAARQLPDLLSTRELAMIAGDEAVATPTQGLKDYRNLYAQVHAWPVNDDTPVLKERTRLWFQIEEFAIEAYAEQGKFKQAIRWLAAYDPGNMHHESPAWSYGVVIRDMLQRQEFAGASAAFQQCTEENDGFSFYGAGAAIGNPGLGEMERLGLASAGISAAAGAVDNILLAARFLADVHTAFPDMDGEVEDAALALLQQAHRAAASNPAHAGSYARGGAHRLALLEQLDPERAATERAAFPAAGGVAANPGIIELSPTGQPVGVAAGPGAAVRLGQEATKQPGEALADAAKLNDTNAHFSALAEIALTLAKAHPQHARTAADAANELLDTNVAMAEDGYAVDLAHAYAELLEPGREQDVARQAAAALNTHAQQSEAQMDVSTPEAVANTEKHLFLPSLLSTSEYKNLASFDPADAWAQVQQCRCPILQPLIFAKIAETMTPAGQKAVP